MEIVTIDFETFYDNGYSLSRCTTEEYVRDPRFQVIGMGWKWGAAPPSWHHPDNIQFLLSAVDWANTAVLCHNTFFDGSILGWKFGVKPKLWLDTISMARPFYGKEHSLSLKTLASVFNLGDKGIEAAKNVGKRLVDFTQPEWLAYGDYCMNDVEITYKLYSHLASKLPPKEFAIIDQSLRMYIEPRIELNREKLKEHLGRLEISQEDLVARCGIAPNVLRSNEKFAEYLKSLGVDPPKTISKATKQVTWSFGKSNPEFYALLEHEDERVATAVAARIGVRSSIETTRAKSLLGVSERGRLPIMLHYYGGHTGRDSGGDRLNLQNLPRNGALRRCLIAPRGYKFLAADLSQIEARITAWLSGEFNLLSEFEAQDANPSATEDVYTKFASLLFGRTITKADTAERFIGKTCILGLGYGMAGTKLLMSLKSGKGKDIEIDVTTTNNYVNVYRKAYPNIPRLWDCLTKAIPAMESGVPATINLNNEWSILVGKECIYLPNGMRLHYPVLTRVMHGWRQTADYFYASRPQAINNYATAILLDNTEEGKTEAAEKFLTRLHGASVTENISQALANIVLKDASLRIGERYPVVLRVHDEVVCLIPENEELIAKTYVYSCMTKRLSWAPNLPIGCEIGIADNYGDC